DYTVHASLAKSDPTKISETEWEVELRDDAKYSDGSDVTADDVVNAFEKNMENDTYSAFLEFIDSVEAKDDTTITFNLKYAFDNLLTGRLAVVKIFPKDLTDDELDTDPIGSGPWKYDSVDGNDGGHIIFVPNDYYNGDYPATCEKMDWNVLLDDTSRTTAITEGTVQAIEAVPDANASQVEASGATVEYVPGFALPFLMFNCKKAPFDDYRVRQAFFYAIDYDKLIANAMDGHATACTCLLPDYYDGYHEASTVYTYDPDKAKELLEEAGATDLTCTLRSNSNWVQDLAPSIIEDLKAVGIDITNEETQGANMFSDLSPEAAEQGELPYDVMLSPGDPSCFGNDPDLLMSWWYGDNIWTQGRSCWAGTEEFDQLQDLMQQARVESDSSAQQDLWDQCYDIIAEQCPIYPLFHRQLPTGYYEDELEGFEPIGTTGLVFLGTTPLDNKA
ncbi:MAG: ABC transporter substrate-binding protein, partial [Eggerthellaceae bacterium]|nr:ABC transporter substrate-binding protein [Eggerthellaceae bacterium]